MSAFRSFATRFFQRSSTLSSILSRSASSSASHAFPCASGASSAAFPVGPSSLLLLGGGSLLLSQLLASEDSKGADCCGIVAYVGNEGAVNYLLEGLHILQTRGYDSAGVTTVHAQDEASYALITSSMHQRNSTRTALSSPTTPEAKAEQKRLTVSPPVHGVPAPQLSTLTASSSSSTAPVSAAGGHFELLTTKYASKGSTSDCIELLKKDAPSKHQKDRCGIAHTRWATHGGKTDENAHPHVDYKGRVALVHNGTIENSNELKQELEELGINFKSQTDTEVIVQLIGFYLDQGLGPLEATKKTLSRLEGTWGLAILFKEAPSQVIAARNGSPIVVGIGKDRMFVASEISAFCRHTNQYISLKDGEVAVIHSEGVSLDLSRIEKAPEEKIELSPAPYPHWTIKEIVEQPEAISRTLNYGGRFDAEGHVKLGGLESNAELLLSIKHLVMSACGTSLFASGYGERIFRSLRCFDSVQTIDASEVTPDSFPREDGGILVLSQSGETKDTHRALVTANTLLLPCFSIINIVGSLIARTAGIGVYLNAGREHAVASTKAFTTQVTALALVAGWFSQKRDQSRINVARRAELMESIHRLPIYTGMTLKLHEQCKEIAQKLQKKDHLFLLGKGYAESIAREGALKIKEITYIHAEGYSGGALKHGPFALLDNGTPVFLLIFSDEHAELMRIAAQEVRARGAHNFIITDKKSLADGIADSKDIIQVPSNGPLTALLSVIPLQLIAYEISILRGINPDKPRHLAKAVTVD